MNLMEFFSSLVLVNVVITLITNLLIFYKCIRIFTKKHIRLKVSPTLLLFVGYLLVLSISTIGYCIYLLIFWRPVENLYNESTLYMVGFISWILLISNPIFEFCLCIERCAAVCFSLRYNWKWKRNICLGTISLVAIYIGLNIWINDLIHLKGDISSCMFFTCVVYADPTRLLVEFKIAVSVLDIFAAVFLIILMKFKLTTIRKKNKNTVILIIIFITTVFEFLPNLVDYIIGNFTHYRLINFTGPYRTTISSINLLIIIILYSQVLKKPTSEVNTMQIYAAKTNAAPKLCTNKVLK